jgi:hypothetical protein
MPAPALGAGGEDWERLTCNPLKPRLPGPSPRGGPVRKLHCPGSNTNFGNVSYTNGHYGRNVDAKKERFELKPLEVEGAPTEQETQTSNCNCEHSPRSESFGAPDARRALGQDDALRRP